MCFVHNYKTDVRAFIPTAFDKQTTSYVYLMQGNAGASPIIMQTLITRTLIKRCFALQCISQKKTKFIDLSLF